MDLQNTFYLLGIIFMSFSILILLSIVVLLFLIINGIRGIHKNINDKIDLFAERATSSSNLAVDIGTAVAGSVIKKAKQAFDKQK
jgi:hypothetical protein